MRLAIDYRFDTNKPSRAGMRFSAVAAPDTLPDGEQGRGGPVFNGLTPGEMIVSGDAFALFAFIDARVGRTWATWSLIRLEPYDYNPEADTYAVLPEFVDGRKYRATRATLICGRTPRGRVVINRDAL